MNAQLTYRDFVTQIICAIFCNVIAIVVFRDVLPYDVLTEKIENEFLWTLVAIPLLMVEGHLIWSIDNLLFVILITEKHKYKLYTKCKELCKLFFGHRIFYYKIKQFDKVYGNSDYEQYKKFNEVVHSIADNEDSVRHESLSDLFKILYFACIVFATISFCRCDFLLAVILLVFAILCCLRAKKYSRLYYKDKTKMFNKLNSKP